MHISTHELNVENREELIRPLIGLIGLQRYSVTINQDSGVMITYWRTTDKNLSYQKYVEARNRISSAGYKVLRNSHSCVISGVGYDGYLARAAQWQQWHSRWIYDTPVNVDLPLNMGKRKTL